MLRSLALAGIGWGLGAAFAAAPVSASKFQVDPTRVELSARQASAMLTLTNRSPDDIRFQVTVHAWTQSEDGEMVLEPTDELVAYPSLIRAAPGERQRIRVGVTEPAGATEDSYRLFVEELPPAGDVEPGVHMRMRIGVPVFVAAQQPTTSARFGRAVVDDGTLSFSLRNTGSSHIRLREVSAVGVSATGEELFRERIDGWYLLPGLRRVYRRPVGSECAELARVDLEASDRDHTWTRSLSPRCRDGE